MKIPAAETDIIDFAMELTIYFASPLNRVHL
jgi:hypothetical protein